jgi:outer membrane protein TolC
MIMLRGDELVKKVFLFAVLFFSSSFVFADELTLKSSIDTAMDKSPAIIYARQGVIAADGKLGQAFGAVLPALSLSAQYGQSYTQPYDMMGIITVGTEEASTMTVASLHLNQPIYVGALLPALDIAKAGYEVAKASLKKAEFDLRYNVVNSYYGVLRAQKLYDLSNDSLDMAKSHLNQVKAMYVAGTATKADVLRSEVQVANTELSLTKAENALDLAKDAFNNVLGRSLELPVDLSEKEIAHEIVKPKPYSDCLAVVFDVNPDWITFQLNKKINQKNVDVASSGYYPAISLVGTYANNKNEYVKNDFLNTNYNSWTLLLNGSWTLFDGFSTASKIKEAGANLAAIEANEELTKNGIVLEVKDACLNLNSAVNSISSAKKAVESADENYRISREKYKSGIGSNLEMIDAQTALTEAKTNLYQAQFDYQIAKAKVNKALGKEIYSFSASADK